MQRISPWTGRLHVDKSWAAFRGASSSNTLHSHIAVQLCVGHAGRLVIVDEAGNTTQSRGIVVRPGVAHRLEPSSDVTLLFVEPQTAPAQSLLQLVPTGPIAGMPEELCERIATSVTPSEILAELAMPPCSKIGLDTRLNAALAFLVEAAVRDSIAQAAQHVGLSPSRLRALAQAQLGVPLASWVMWRKLERAGTAIMTGAGLAEAAVEGRFVDQAHFGHAMRKVFGITPGELSELAKAQSQQAKHTRRGK